MSEHRHVIDVDPDILDLYSAMAQIREQKARTPMGVAHAYIGNRIGDLRSRIDDQIREVHRFIQSRATQPRAFSCPCGLRVSCPDECNEPLVEFLDMSLHLDFQLVRTHSRIKELHQKFLTGNYPATYSPWKPLSAPGWETVTDEILSRCEQARTYGFIANDDTSIPDFSDLVDVICFEQGVDPRAVRLQPPVTMLSDIVPNWDSKFWKAETDEL